MIGTASAPVGLTGFSVAVLLAVLASMSGAAAEPAWPETAYNPVPAPDDLLLPMPCDGAMAFRVIAVGPQPRTLAQGTDLSGLTGPLPLSPDGQGAYLLGKYEVSRLQAAALRAFAQDSDCPSALDPAQVGQDQTSRALAADQRRPEAYIAWHEARELADDYAAWLRLHGSDYPSCNAPNPPSGPCLPRLASEAAVVRLPTEPEWEYAARGGQTVSAAAFRNPLPPLTAGFDRYAWTKANAGADPWPIGSRLTGPLGLHDIFGNVSEIQYATEASERGEVFIARGGGYQSQPGQADSRYRDRFRVYDEQGRGRLSETGLRLLIGAPVAVDAVPPPPAAALAYLQVQTSVPATVRLDGSEVGRAKPAQPLRLSDRLPGEHLLLVQADGYRPHQETIELDPGVWTQVRIRLEPDAAHQEAGLSRAQWQQIRDQLKTLGHDPGQPGLWAWLSGGVSEATRSALRAFQQQQGLQPDGHATDATRAALTEAMLAQAKQAEAARLAAQARQRQQRAEAARRAAQAAAEAAAKRQVEEAARQAAEQVMRRDRAGTKPTEAQAAGPANRRPAQAVSGNLSRAELARAQTLLLELGYDPGRVDGTMSADTSLAIKRFEAARGRPQTGIASPGLLWRLEQRYHYLITRYGYRDPTLETQCVMKRVMSDSEYRACGLNPPSQR